MAGPPLRPSSHVVLLDGYSRHNTGDWLLFEKSVAIIRERHPGCRVLGVALDPDSFAGLTSADEVLSSPVRPGNVAPGMAAAVLALLTGGRLGAESFRLISNATAVYSVGGGFLQFRSARELASAGGVHGLQWLMARRSGARVAMLPQSVGPFRGAVKRRLGRWLLNIAIEPVVRDEASRECVRSLSPALAGRVRLVPDLVFTDPRLPAGPGEDRPVGVVVRNWWFPGHSDPAAAERSYLQQMASVIDGVSASGREVELVIHSDGPSARGDDRIATNTVLGLLSRPVPVVSVCDASSPAEAAARYARYALVISVRLHAALLALQQGAAAIAIAYEPKSSEIFEQLGISDWVRRADGLSAPDLLALAARPFPQELVTERWSQLHDEVSAYVSR